MFKKTLLAASMAAALSAGPAMAGTWDADGDAAGTDGSAVYATELFGDGTTVITPAATAKYTFAATPGAGSSFLVDLTLSSGTWGAALTSASLAFVDAGAVSGATSLLVAGGAATDSTAQFRVDVTAAINAGDGLALTYTVGGTSALASATGSIKMAIAINDNLGPVDTAGAAANIARAVDETTIAASTAGSAGQIDVTTGSTKFTTAAVSTTSVDLGNFTITDNATGVEDDGATAFTANAGDAGVTSGTVTISGNFAASLGVDADATPATNDGVQLSGCVAADATTLTATEATFSLTGAQVAAALGTACDVTMNVDGTTVLDEFTPSLTVAVDYTNAKYADESFTGSLYSLTKNGDTVDADLMLTPGGVFSGYVRINNKSSVTGKVIATLFNDAGDAVTFDLADGVLDGQSSTALITVEDLYAQAQAADATFDHNGGKLRARFEGEFSAIEAQSITISTDNSTFTTF